MPITNTSPEPFVCHQLARRSKEARGWLASGTLRGCTISSLRGRWVVASIGCGMRGRSGLLVLVGALELRLELFEGAEALGVEAAERLGRGGLCRRLARLGGLVALRRPRAGLRPDRGHGAAHEQQARGPAEDA